MMNIMFTVIHNCDPYKSKQYVSSNLVFTSHGIKYTVSFFRAPMFHLPMIWHTFAKHSIRYCLINLLNKDTRSTLIMEGVDTDPNNSLLFTSKDKYWSYIRKYVSLLTVMFAADLKLMICSWMILDGVIYSLIAWS